jgi:hypothetical protein
MVRLPRSLNGLFVRNGFNAMKAYAGRATLFNILEETARLAFIRKLNLPRNILSIINPAWTEQVARRVSAPGPAHHHR